MPSPAFPFVLKLAFYRKSLMETSLVVAIVLVGTQLEVHGQVQQASHQSPQAEARHAAVHEVKWLTSATEAAKLAQTTGKPILVYVRSESCYYCDLLQKNTWQDPQTQAMIMRDMIPLKLTLENDREAVEAMKVKGFPSTIVFSPTREYLARIDGYVSPQDFQSRISQVRTARVASRNKE